MISRFSSAISVVLVCTLCVFPSLQVSPAAEQDRAITHTSVQVSLLPGFGTHPRGRVEADFSVNILAGRVYQVNKFEIGGLFNWVDEESNGFQMAGCVNYVGGSQNGVQLSGLSNYTGDDAAGIHLAGLGNLATADNTGIDLAGLLNYAGKDATGIYLAGLANYSGRDNTGILLSGLLNYIGEESTGIYLTGGVSYVGNSSTGIYLSALGNVTRGAGVGIHLAGLFNYSRNYTGIAAAPVNYGEDVEGIQFGLFNYAETLNGTPIGLVSYVSRVGLRFDAWASDTAPLTVALRSGNRKYYNLLAAGVNPYNDPVRYQIGWGFGRVYILGNRTTFDVDGIIYRVIVEDDDWENLNHLLKARFLYGWHFTERVGIYAGPTLNLFITDHGGADEVALWAPEEHTWKRGDTKYYFWPGLVLGVKF